MRIKLIERRKRLYSLPLICEDENIIMATPPITPIILKPSSSNIINEKPISPSDMIRINGSSTNVCPKAILMPERTPSLLP
jgi:hypothetical protein